MEDTLFAKRTSIRQYKPDAVPQPLIDQLLDAAVSAPSAGNCQPWHFYVVRNAQAKEALCAGAYNQRFIQDAPVVIVVCAEPARSAERYASRGETLYCLQDTAAATENLLLCAAQLGLGTCWCGAFDEDAVRRALSLPQDRRPVAVIPVGYPKGIHPRAGRRPMKKTVTYMD